MFDLVNIIIFIGLGSWSHWSPQKKPQSWEILEVGFIFCSIFFGLTVVFYVLTVFSDPGYVPRSENFLELLDKMVDENLHLDYICVYCENLRPENSDHCNFCNRCV